MKFKSNLKIFFFLKSADFDLESYQGTKAFPQVVPITMIL